MSKAYVQTELAIEVAKKALEDLCKEYGYDCKVFIGEQLVTIVQEAPMFENCDDCWPEVIACNIPESSVKEYLYSQKIYENYHTLLQTERITNE